MNPRNPEEDNEGDEAGEQDQGEGDGMQANMDESDWGEPEGELDVVAK